ncbi:MAG: hypothetical protein NT062_12600 [Proteobacteria bacterium]|nr:hypothetical protein [Pseudomonadota bacterium]
MTNAWRGLAVIALMGCHGTTEAPRAAAGSSASAPIIANTPTPTEVADAGPITTNCVPPDFGGAVSTFVAVDETHVLMCLTRTVQWAGHTDETKCLRIDLTTGHQLDAAPLPTTMDDRPVIVAPRFKVTDTPKGVTVCWPNNACRKLALAPVPVIEDMPREGYGVDVSDDNRTVVATPPMTVDVKKTVHVLDAQTGKVRAKITVGDATYACPGEAQFLGDTIYVPAARCNAPKAVGRLYDRTGKPLGTVDAVNVASSSPYPLDERRWAIAGSQGNGVAIVDVVTGETTSAIASTPQLPPAACPYCGAIDVASSSGTYLTTTPSGRLLEASAGVVVFDAAITRIERHLPLQLCSAPTSAPRPR